MRGPIGAPSRAHPRTGTNWSPDQTQGHLVTISTGSMSAKMAYISVANEFICQSKWFGFAGNIRRLYLSSPQEF